ncbi:hypothetical protein CR162_07990 [Pseudoroseomonas rhizosphaerae]|uniref:Tripartite tricarboxylate transporter substrate binding protein n=1 Tax=Teichococcus rhizosphaerae TaxID=1335062 RepID=A0A2C7AAJ8_9PROT|nr:tripartite tricarboxylate transporter substrate binding protein [Pseudoroseomonas rhizosphaerae]PHK95420.1 hypothetical protein CR162_07990 [Pseudoroseomonas rhizosphaerae]
MPLVPPTRLPTRLPVLARRALLGMAAGLAMPGLARAQGSFPSRPVSIIVPFTAGGTTDQQMRALADGGARRLGQPVVIENRPGGGGTLGVAATAKARPDGYTLAQMITPAMRLAMLQSMSYDVLRDFSPVIHLTGYFFGLAVRADAPWESWQDFVKAARARPGQVSVGNSGANGTLHLGMLELGLREDVQFNHVPYRGEAETVTALLGGHVNAVANSAGLGELVDNGQARWLNVWTAARSRRWPDVPTLVELGYEGMVITSPYGLVGPAGMDPAVVGKLHDAFRAAMDDPAHRAVLQRADMEAEYLGPEDYAGFLRAQVERERTLLRRLKLLPS